MSPENARHSSFFVGSILYKKFIKAFFCVYLRDGFCMLEYVYRNKGSDMDG